MIRYFCKKNMRHFIYNNKFLPESFFYGKRICSSIIPFIEDPIMQFNNTAKMKIGMYDMYTNIEYEMPIVFENIIIRSITKEIKRNFFDNGENDMDIMYFIELQICNSIVEYSLLVDDVKEYRHSGGNENALKALSDFFIHIIPFINFFVDKKSKDCIETCIFVLGTALRRKDGINIMMNNKYHRLYITQDTYKNIEVKSNYHYTYRVGRDDIETWTTSVSMKPVDFMSMLFLKLIVKRKAKEENSSFYSRKDGDIVTYGYSDRSYSYGPTQENSETTLNPSFITDLMSNYYEGLVDYFIDIYKEYLDKK